MKKPRPILRPFVSASTRAPHVVREALQHPERGRRLSRRPLTMGQFLDLVRQVAPGTVVHDDHRVPESDDEGFSLVEVVIVLALVVLLAACVVPMFNRPTSTESTLTRVTQAERLFAATTCAFTTYTDDANVLGVTTPGLVLEGVGEPVTCLRGTVRTNAPRLFLHYRATYRGHVVTR